MVGLPIDRDILAALLGVVVAIIISCPLSNIIRSWDCARHLFDSYTHGFECLNNWLMFSK